ncbi:Nipped-B-like protein [Dirofilaria immitis]
MINYTGFGEDQIALLCITTVSLFGLFSNGFSLYITRTRSHFHAVFATLCSGYLMCNLETIFILFIWCAIVLSVKSPMLSSPTTFFVRPIESRAFTIMIISWTLGTILCMMHLYKECSFIFNEKSNYLFSYQNSYYGKICANTVAAASVGIAATMACIDFTTLIKVNAYRRTVQKNSVNSVVSAIKERDVLFFKQSCIISSFYTVCVATFATNSYFFTDKWLLFALNTITFILMLSLDGLTPLFFDCMANRWKNNFHEIAASKSQINKLEKFSYWNILRKSTTSVNEIITSIEIFDFGHIYSKLFVYKKLQKKFRF